MIFIISYVSTESRCSTLLSWDLIHTAFMFYNHCNTEEKHKENLGIHTRTGYTNRVDRNMGRQVFTRQKPKTRTRARNWRTGPTSKSSYLLIGLSETLDRQGSSVKINFWPGSSIASCSIWGLFFPDMVCNVLDVIKWAHQSLIESRDGEHSE